MPYNINEPPERIKKLPKSAQRIWISAFNAAYEEYNHNEETANKVAWSAVKKKFIKKGESWIRIKASFSFPISLSDAKIKDEMEINIIPIGEWKHAIYGDIKITEIEVEEFVQHFNQGIRKGVTVTEGHWEPGMNELPAVGWFKELINKKEKGLWGIVEWNDKGRELLEQKAYKYFSPEFYVVYEDSETHKVYNNVLVGGALTNSPYFKGLKSIVMSDNMILDQFNINDMSTKENKKVVFDENEENEDIDEDDEKEDDIDEELDDISDTEEEELSEKESVKTTHQKKSQLLSTKSKKKKVSCKELIKENLSEQKEEEKIIYQAINSGEVQLSEKENLSEFKKELLRVGKWYHGASQNGVLNVTKEFLENIIKNFKDKVLDNVFVPLGHPDSDDPSKNVGEVICLDLENDKLMATVDVKDETVMEKIKNGLIKHISASIADNYMKKDTGEKVGPTLFHAALVSEPYIKGMAGFVPLSEDMKGSIVIPIDMEKDLTLQELSCKMKKIEEMLEKVLNLKESENKNSDDTNMEKEKVLSEQSKPEETLTKEETKSPEVDEKIEEGKEEETKEEETEDKIVEEKLAETKDEGVSLVEAEKIFGELLSEGKVVPSEKVFLIPLLVSDTTIELGEKTIQSRTQLIEYLKSQPSKIPLSEIGTSRSSGKKLGTNIDMSDDVKRAANKIFGVLELTEEEGLEVLKEVVENKKIQ